MKTFVQKLLGLAGTLIVAVTASAQNYSIDSFSIDNGGGTSTDGLFAVSGTIRRPDAEPMSGGGFTVSGEIQSIIAAVAAPATGEPPPTVEALYAANANNTIEKFTPEGISSLFASTGLNAPYGLAFDSAGNLYAASGNQIVKFTPEGDQSVFAASGLNKPAGLALDSQGNLYAANTGNNTIAKFTPQGVGSVFADAGLSIPYGLAIDRADNLYVANLNNRILKFTPDGLESVFANTGLNRPTGLAIDRAGNLYAAIYSSGAIQKFTPEGLGSVFASGLSGPLGLAFDSAGNLYVVATSGSTIQKFTPDGAQSVFGNTGLQSPTFIAFAPVASNVVSPPSELRITALSLSGTELRFSFSASSGQSYVIESRADLAIGAWAEVPGTRTTSSGATRQLVLPIALAQPQQFYRVRMLP